MPFIFIALLAEKEERGYVMKFTNNENDLEIYEKDYADYKEKLDEAFDFPTYNSVDFERQVVRLKKYLPESETEVLYVDNAEIEHFNKVFSSFDRLAIKKGGYIKAVIDFVNRDAYIMTRIDFIEFCDEEGYTLLSEINSDSTLTTISAMENGWIEIYINIPVFKFLFAV